MKKKKDYNLSLFIIIEMYISIILLELIKIRITKPGIISFSVSSMFDLILIFCTILVSLCLLAWLYIRFIDKDKRAIIW